ncbi:MAG: hypothetical protein V1747_08065 [Candidatus Omnitrophota bacterium]
MKNINSVFIAFLQAVLVLAAVLWVFQQSGSPLQDGLYLKYETTLNAVNAQLKTTHELRFTKKEKKQYQVDIQADGFLPDHKSYIIDKYFIDQEGVSLPGPSAAVLWSAPYLLWIGNQTAAGEVIKHTNWKGYSVAVVQDPALANCYGFYERNTGLQVGYMNCFSSQKLLTVLKETNIKGL